MGCAFCLTGKMGLVRHLTAGEIAGQVRVLAHETRPRRLAVQHRPHGHGRAAAQLRRDDEGAAGSWPIDEGLAVHPRRITLSTVGLVPALERLANEPLMPNLAISLHATTDSAARRARADQSQVLRSRGAHRRLQALPAAPPQPDHVRVRAARRRQRHAGGRAPARALLDGIKAKVNLLPLNEAPGIPFTRPSDERVDAFAKILADRGVRVSVRKSRGRDIRAACGQLIVEGELARSALDRRSPAWRSESVRAVCSSRLAAASTFSSSFFL